MPRKHLLVKGRVQGIGYRWFVREAAERLGVSGWVRNRPDGDVELEAEGESKALGSLLKELRSGHGMARVESIEEKDIPEEGTPGFGIRGW